MSLTTVKKFDKRARAGILAHVAQRYLPSSDDFEVSVEDDQERLIIQEINTKFNVQKGGMPTSKLEVVQRLLLQELRASLLEPTQVKNVRDRVGQKGLLRTDLYDIHFNESFIDLNIPMGVSKELAVSAIHKPLAVEHVHPEAQGLTQVESHSIFTAFHPSIENCVVLVLAVRKLATLVVDGAWLIPLEELGLHESPPPLKLLQMFAERYGVTLKVGETNSNFIYQTSFPMKSGEQNNILSFVDQSRTLLTDTRFSFSFNLGHVQIALAFAIRLSDYISDLKKHGVNVTRVLPVLQVSPLLRVAG